MDSNGVRFVKKKQWADFMTKANISTHSAAIFKYTGDEYIDVTSINVAEDTPHHMWFHNSAIEDVIPEKVSAELVLVPPKRNRRSRAPVFGNVFI